MPESGAQRTKSPGAILDGGGRPEGRGGGTGPRNPDIDYERTDLSLSAIAIIALGILLLLGVTPLIMIDAFPLARGDVDRHLSITPPQPRLQTDPEADLAAYVGKERHLLGSYGWIDREHGITHIPIEVAMARLIRTGIPGFPPASSGQKTQEPLQPQARHHGP
jgi:hypothetical protein